MGRGAGSGGRFRPEELLPDRPEELPLAEEERLSEPPERLELLFFCVEEANGIILSKNRHKGGACP